MALLENRLKLTPPSMTWHKWGASANAQGRGALGDARHAQPMMRDRRRSASMCAAVISRGDPAEQFRRVRGNSPCTG